MRCSTFAAGLLAVTATVNAAACKARGVCNADNCARLVTGTRAGLPSTRLADCSSYQIKTVTGSAATSTVTVTPVETVVTTYTTNTVFNDVTVTQTPSTVVRPTATQPAKRDASANSVPAYAASSCPGDRYASACSCAGVKATTTTLPGSTVTTTVTGSAAISYISTAADATAVRTTTATAPAAVKTGYTCGSTVQGNGIYSFRRYKVNCGQRVTSGNIAYSTTASDESSCLRVCNSIKYCVYAEYIFFPGTCNLYYTSPTAIVDDDNVDALILL